MKEKREKKLRLDKITVQDFDSILEKGEQKVVLGGSVNGESITVVPVFCMP